jgi:hypothetical protein
MQLEGMRLNRLTTIMLWRLLLALVLSLGTLTACTQSAQPMAPQAEAVPDLTSLVSHLTSPDPNIQELALVPSVRASAGEAPGVLPPGSQITLAPSTWAMKMADNSSGLYRASIQAAVTRPGLPPANFSLFLAHVGDQWLLYDSRPL